MTSLVRLGVCPVCNTTKYVPAYSNPPQLPQCGCSETSASRFSADVAEAFAVFRNECQDEDIRDTILRMHNFLAVVGAAHAEGDGKGFVSGLIGLSALAKVLSETVHAEHDESEDGGSP